MKKLLAVVLCSGTFGILLLFNQSFNQTLEPTLYLYIIQNFLQDTDSKNAIAAILLNYRMYDTMFEALILLTAIIGMQQFLPRTKDMQIDSPGNVDSTQRPSGDYEPTSLDDPSTREV